nr:isoform 7 of zonadhesin [Quercus suber]
MLAELQKEKKLAANTPVSKTLVSTKKPVVSTKKPVTPVDSFKKPVSSTIELVDKMLADLQKEKKLAANTPVSKPLVSTKKPVVSTKKPVTPVDSFKKPVSSTIELVDKMLADLQKEKKLAANTPVSKSLVSTKKPVVSTKKPVTPVDSFKKPVSSTIELIDKMLAELQKEKKC